MLDLPVVLEQRQQHFKRTDTEFSKDKDMILRKIETETEREKIREKERETMREKERETIREKERESDSNLEREREREQTRNGIAGRKKKLGEIYLPSGEIPMH